MSMFSAAMIDPISIINCYNDNDNDNDNDNSLFIFEGLRPITYISIVMHNLSDASQ